MAGRDEIGLPLNEVQDRLQVAVVFHVVAEDDVVAHHAVRAPGGEERVAREGYSAAVDTSEQRHLVFGVAGRVRDFEFKLFPLELLAVLERARHFERFGEDAPQVPAARIFENVHHVFVTPDLGAVTPDQVRESVHVIVVHVRWA